MKLNVYSMFDSAAKAFTRPMFFNLDGEAIRAFQTEANRKDSPVCNFPDQFTMFHIGTYDDSTSVFVSVNPRSLGLAIQYKESFQSVEDRLSLAAMESLLKTISDKMEVLCNR